MTALGGVGRSAIGRAIPTLCDSVGLGAEGHHADAYLADPCPLVASRSLIPVLAHGSGYGRTGWSTLRSALGGNGCEPGSVLLLRSLASIQVIRSQCR
jgi:hypothetical protein